MGYGIVMVVAAVISQQAPAGKPQFEKAKPAAKAAEPAADKELKEARRLLHNGRYAEAEEAFAAVRAAAQQAARSAHPGAEDRAGPGPGRVPVQPGGIRQGDRDPQGGRGR